MDIDKEANARHTVMYWTVIQTDLSAECCISVALTAVFQHKEQEISCQKRKTTQNKLKHVLHIHHWTASPTIWVTCSREWA